MRDSRRFLEGGALVVILLLLAALLYSTQLAREARSDIDNLVRLMARMYPMQDVVFVQRGDDWFAVIRQDGEGADQFASRMAAISSGAIDPMQTHLCATVSGCDEGRTVHVCIAILPGFTQAENEAKLAELKAAVCAAIHCTVGCE